MLRPFSMATQLQRTRPATSYSHSFSPFGRTKYPESSESYPFIFPEWFVYIFSMKIKHFFYMIAPVRIPMLVGRAITLVSCVMYIFVEFIPTNRRWWMLVCYLLFGVGFGTWSVLITLSLYLTRSNISRRVRGFYLRARALLKAISLEIVLAGTSPLLRSYIARVTTEENRASAYALQNGAVVLSVMVGPSTFPHIMLNETEENIWWMRFCSGSNCVRWSSLSWRRYHPSPHQTQHLFWSVLLSSGFESKIFPAPIWFAVITNIIAILITACLLKDTEEVEELKNGEKLMNTLFWMSNVQERHRSSRWLRSKKDSLVLKLWIFRGFSLHLLYSRRWSAHSSTPPWDRECITPFYTFMNTFHCHDNHF